MTTVNHASISLLPRSEAFDFAKKSGNTVLLKALEDLFTDPTITFAVIVSVGGVLDVYGGGGGAPSLDAFMVQLEETRAAVAPRDASPIPQSQETPVAKAVRDALRAMRDPRECGDE